MSILAFFQRILPNMNDPPLPIGGFSGAVSASVSKENQIAAAEFFAFATSAKKAIKYVIPDANNPDANPVPTGMDPYAKSMLNVDEWTSRGFDLKSTEEYKFAIESQLDSSNVVIDLHMPAAADFMATLDDVTTQYCNDTKFNKFDKDPALVRADLSIELGEQWRDIVTDYDSAEGREEGALLELLQRDRGVYVPKKSLSVQHDDLSSGVIVAIVVCATTVFAMVVFVIASFVRQYETKKREDMWYVDPNDIHDTNEVLGRGSFGVVTKGFLRGTPVALKHAKGWEPVETVKAKSVDMVEEVPTNEPQSGTKQRMNSMASSPSFNSIDGSTIGSTLLNEQSPPQGRYFFSSRKNQRKKCADDSLRAELLLLVRLRHDNIVQTLGASQDDKKKRLVLILQYMENGPIRYVLTDPNGVAGTAGMSLEIQWALQVARGLNFLHTIPPPSGPLVHADLKSSNVLLDSSFNANISDFGLATKTMKGLWGAIQRSTKSNNPRGSILWMAPEVLNGADPTPASDVYSYSMFLVELMTRDRPYGVRAFEVRSSDGSKDRRFSEFSDGAECDRRSRFSTSSNVSDNIEEEASSDDPDLGADATVKQPDAPTAGLDNVKQLKQGNGSTKRGIENRVSWSLNCAESDIAVPVTSPESEAKSDDYSSKNMRINPNSKLEIGSKDFYAMIDGEAVTRDEIVNKVKDLALDPPFRPNLPDSAPQVLVDICTECWQKNPKRRPTMKEVEERLLEAVSSSTWTQQLMRRGSVFDSILPPDVQDKLARGEQVKPQIYDDVTVLFSDIVGFTSISSALTAEETGDLISRLFTKFDDLCKANGVKKLDVIGDAFLGVVGVPNAMPDHANRAARFALNAITAAKETIICPAKPQLGYAKVRIGLASGTVVATVIGTREHPKYTLFGDAVNTASRMESTSLPNRCQVTQVTAELIRSYGNADGITLASRGMMEVKGKGSMETYFLEEMHDQDTVVA